MLKQVEFRFPTDTQVRYLERLPQRGEQVHGAAGETFVVARLERDDNGAWAVTCVRDREFRRELREETDATTDPIRAAQNEVLLRDYNERIEAHHQWAGSPFADWVCECADESCSQDVQLSIAEYEAVRAHPTHFLVAPAIEHVDRRIERVVRREDRYWVLEKVGVGAEISEELDPRSP